MQTMAFWANMIVKQHQSLLSGPDQLILRGIATVALHAENLTEFLALPYLTTQNMFMFNHYGISFLSE